MNATDLNEHLAGETLAVELAKRASLENKGTPLGTFLEMLSWALEEDRESLVKLMGELGVRRKHGWLGHLRRTGSLPMSTAPELESLSVSINAKLEMWSTLRSSVGDRVHDIDFEKLIRRAEGQSEALDQRLAATC